MHKSVTQSEQKTQAWCEDLVKLGYAPPLPAPIPAVQSTIAAINIPEFHSYIQEADLAAIGDTDDEGLHAPLLLDSLDLAAWTSLFVLATTDSVKAVSRLKVAQTRLADLLCEDEAEADRSALLAQKVESVLKLANADELTAETASAVAGHISGSGAGAGTVAHPLLAKLTISAADMSALENFSDDIQMSQAEKHKNTMIASKGPVVPIKPNRSVELLVADYQHRMWAIGNTNLIAPISIPMWKAWAGFSDQEVENCKKQAFNNMGVLRAPMDLMHAFPLNMFDHSKCTTVEVKLHTKQDLPTGHNRKESHLSEMWNVQRPYMRCLCNPRATSGCKGSIIWFDHAVWTMINKLEVFFPNYPTAIARLAAFMIWMHESAKVAVKAAIVFQVGREQMIKAAIQLAENPSQRLLMDISDTPIASKIERLLKGPKFSLAHPGSPSQAPSPYKKQKLNLNSSPSDKGFVGGRGRGNISSRGSSPGFRGGRASRGRGGGRAGFRNPNLTPPGRMIPGLAGASGSDSLAVQTLGAGGNPGTQQSPATSLLNSPLKARVLLWDDDSQ